MTPERARVEAATLMAAAVNQAVAEWNAGGWRQHIPEALRIRQSLDGYDPRKAEKAGGFVLLSRMPLAVRYFLDEEQPDGMRDALQNRDYRRWLVTQPEVAYLKDFKLFTEDWEALAGKRTRVTPPAPHA